MAYRRDRTVRDAYEERFLSDRPGPYSRAGGDRRGHFSRPEEDYNRGGYEYEGGPRFFPNGGGPRNYHGDDQRGYPGDGAHFPSERRGAPPSRREDFPYRGPREDSHTGGRPMEYSNRAPPPPPPPNARNQGVYPAPRSLPESGADTLVQAILNLERGEDRDHFRRKAPPFPPPRERSPARRDSARSPHSRSGSSVSSRGYSPDRAKSLLFPSQQEKIPGLSREGSPHSATSNKEENHPPEGEKEQPSVAPVTEESPTASTDKFQQRRSLAIAAKVQEIEKVYRQDCETFGMVVKMLVAKDPNLEKQLQVPLRENLGEIRERCLEDVKHFIGELDEAIRQPETLACDSATPSATQSSQKPSKTAANHSLIY
ncbi:periphilin-1 isoform X1 [Nerophis lumbriciformis]|uniref:periphilin-1 isoform X1 n=1 Tax=Nerophis lumbriciformis TaxID=546530 RepID=UPI002ADF0FAF|nr:periphilin-1 isoform X1 [Nerophis lumbriciformis]XP_061817441.1 periphilin-1 isoform X1 [Nerophis lumbriciformis]